MVIVSWSIVTQSDNDPSGPAVAMETSVQVCVYCIILEHRQKNQLPGYAEIKNQHFSIVFAGMCFSSTPGVIYL